MLKFAEYVSPGHPDKIADYISQYLLDRYISIDPETRYGVEVMIKDNHVTLGGEVSSLCSFTKEEITAHVRAAVNEIGYTREYLRLWGPENTICGDDIDVDIHIREQSPDIALGLDRGWGDQGMFFGYARYDDYGTKDPLTRSDAATLCGLPPEYVLARKVCRMLFEGKLDFRGGGLDIKTQVVVDGPGPRTAGGDSVQKVIVAVPLLNDQNDALTARWFISSLIDAPLWEIIINGTGRYRRHGPLADCGVTGRKLAVDLYGGACRIGGGSPWGKDASKADLTLALLARKIALHYAERTKSDVYTSLACCIGQEEVSFSVRDEWDKVIAERTVSLPPRAVREEFGLDKPIYASMCRWGLFGRYQSDRYWEKTEWEPDGIQTVLFSPKHF